MTPVRPAAAIRATAPVTPVAAAPAMPAVPVAPATPTPHDAPLVDPLSGLDVIDAGPADATPPVEAAQTAAPEAGEAPRDVPDWLSPDTAIRGEFGELVEEIPAGPTAEAPVFPTPPAPWPAVAEPTPSASWEAIAAPVADVPAWPAELDAATPVAGVPVVEGVTPVAGVPAIDADPGRTPPAAWPAVDSAATAPELPSIDDFGFEVASPVVEEPVAAVDEPATAPAPWDDAYGAQADAIHGTLDAELEELTAAPADEPATYLASEWPEPAGQPDPSMLPTPIIAMPAVPAHPTPPAAPTAHEEVAVPAEPVPPDPLLVSASRGEPTPAFGSWAATPGMPAEPSAAEAAGAADDDWGFGAAPEPVSLRPQPTSSSLAAADALERVAQQLRDGTLRADGFSPALGEAAALSAALAALLGVDARWDVR